MSSLVKFPASPSPTLSLRPQHRRLSANSGEVRVRNQYATAADKLGSRRHSNHTSPGRLLRTSQSSSESLNSRNSSDSYAPSTPITDLQSEAPVDTAEEQDYAEYNVTKANNEHATTKVLSANFHAAESEGSSNDSGLQLIENYCCGGGCRFIKEQPPSLPTSPLTAIKLPDNEAFRSLGLKLGSLAEDSYLSGVTAFPAITVSFETPSHGSDADQHTSAAAAPPPFVQPHPPYHVFSAPVYHARELTKPGAEKRTFHFDLDVTDYPEEGDVDFKVGGAIGVCPPNHPDNVDELFNLLGVPKFLRDKPILVKTTTGRWPTIWGDEMARELLTTRRELLTWCADIQSYPPTKPLLRVLAEYATVPNERKILSYLVSIQGQGAFCDLRTGPHLTLAQLLHAFPSSKPPLPDLLSVTSQLMPRFYSLSNDPHVSSDREGLAGRRLIEIAVTVHETPDWRNGSRTGAGSGFLQRVAQQFIAAEQQGERLDLHIPMFRGLMANPLSREFGVSNGPMMLIGAGVGMAPFRGFILNRLRNANCASKIWLVQGVRDSNVDELYSGELGKYEAQIKKVVQSRKARGSSPGLLQPSEADLTTFGSGKPTDNGQWQLTKSQMESRYVQDEVRLQGDVVWNIINSVDGRIFVCGSSKGMGEGVEEALVDIAVERGGLARKDAHEFWNGMKAAGKYIAETW